MWSLYDSAGHAGNGIRSPDQISIRDGILTIDGRADGTTGGMSWEPERRYGRWEVRARFPTGCGCYHPVLLLWPTQYEWPEGGEIDFAEVTKDPQRGTVKFFLHYGADNRQIRAVKDVDMTRWRHFAVEWMPDHISGYVDGVRFFHTTRTDVQPPGPMHLTMQLDWFPAEGSGAAASMEIDWVALYGT